MTYFNPEVLEILTRAAKYPSEDKGSNKPIYIYNSANNPSITLEQVKNQGSLYFLSNSLFNDNCGASHQVLEQVYRKNQWANLAVDVIANTCSATNPLFKIKANNDKKKTKAQNLNELLKYPNKIDTAYTLFNKTYKSLANFGNAYWQVIKNKAGGLHSVYFIPSSCMRAVPFLNEATNNIEIAYYQFDLVKQDLKRVFFMDEIVHFKLPNHISELYGYANLVPIFDDIMFDQTAKKWLNRWFSQSFSGGTILKLNNMNKDVAQRNRAELEEKYQGADNAGRVMLLEGDFDILSDGNRIKDMDFSVLKNISKEDIMNSMKIPLSIAAIRSGSGNGNAEVIKSEVDSFVRNTLSYYQNVVESTINLHLLRGIMRDYDLSFHVGSNTNFPSSNAIDYVKAASQYAGNSVNDNRELMRLPSKEEILVSDGNKYLDTPIVSTNNGLAPLDVVFDSFEKNLEQALTPNSNSLAVNPDKGTVEAKK